MSIEQRGEIMRSSCSLPELLACEESCRNELTTQVESLRKMHKSAHLEQQSHVKHLNQLMNAKRTTLRTPENDRNDRYMQHVQVRKCFQQIQQLDEALALVQNKKDQLRSRQRQALLVKPIQASGVQGLKATSQAMLFGRVLMIRVQRIIPKTQALLIMKVRCG